MANRHSGSGRKPTGPLPKSSKQHASISASNPKTRSQSKKNSSSNSKDSQTNTKRKLDSLSPANSNPKLSKMHSQPSKNSNALDPEMSEMNSSRESLVSAVSSATYMSGVISDDAIALSQPTPRQPSPTPSHSSSTLSQNHNLSSSHESSLALHLTSSSSSQPLNSNQPSTSLQPSSSFQPSSSHSKPYSSSSSNSAGNNNAHLNPNTSVIPTPSDSLPSLEVPPQVPNARPQARIDLSSRLPDSTRQVLLTSKTLDISLAKLNPISIKRHIDNICGPVLAVVHQRSGSLLITTNTFEQVNALLRVEYFGDNNVPVSTRPVFGQQMSYGKLYAPELANVPLEDILSTLEHLGVVAVKKLFGDPRRASIPLYVLTFFNCARPERIQVGYSQYTIDKYIPNPLRCNNCCRFGHSTSLCKDKLRCSHCGHTGHKRDNCTTSTPFCSNCKGPHPSSHPSCPAYLAERHACMLAADTGISFAQARERARLQCSAGNVFQPAPNYNCHTTFPTLPSAQNVPSHPKSTTTTPANNLQTSSAWSTRYNSNGGTNQSATNINVPHPPAEDTYQFPSSLPDPSNADYIIPQTEPSQRQIPSSHPPSLSQSQRPPIQLTYSSHPFPTTLPSFSPTQNPTPPSPSVPSSSTPANFSIGKIFCLLLPALINLCKASSLTDKIQCFIDIGRTLQSETDVVKIISELNISSVLSQ